MTPRDLIPWALQSLVHPRIVLRRILQLELSRRQLFQLAVLLIVLDLMLALILELVLPSANQSESLSGNLLGTFAMLFFILIVGTWLVYFAGRIFRGVGSFDDCFKTVLWMNFVLFLIEPILPLAQLQSDALFGLAFLALLIIAFIQLTAYVMELHQFSNVFLVVLGIFGAQFAFGIVLITVMPLFGVEILLEAQ